MNPLRPHPSFRPRGPVVLVVMDGIGRGAGDEADAVTIAATPTLDRLWVPGARAELKAHGRAVGLPSDDDMGNSEVGHNALGAGKIYAQGARCWSGARSRSGALIFEGDDLEAGPRARRSRRRGPLPRPAQRRQRAREHRAPRGDARRRRARRLQEAVRPRAARRPRHVAPTSALDYVDAHRGRARSKLRDSGPGGGGSSAGRAGAASPRVGSTRGSSAAAAARDITLDRYEADWNMVERGWHAHVLADAPVHPSARAAIEAGRAAHPGIIDQDLPGFVVSPPTPMQDGDACVMFHFRGDRAIEISRAFDDGEDFTKFDRVRRPDVFYYAGMMEYDGDPPHPEALPRSHAPEHRAPDGRDPRRFARHAARDQRNPKIRACDVLLER